MGMLLGSTVYVFSIILAVFLIGIGAGQRGRSRWLLRSTPARRRSGWCQELLSGRCVLVGVHDRGFTAVLADQSDVVGQPMAELPARSGAMLMGDSASRAFLGREFSSGPRRRAKPGEDSGKLVGGIYAANTLGAIVGALAVSIVLVPWIGTRDAQRVILVMAILSAAVVLGPMAWQRSDLRHGRSAGSGGDFFGLSDSQRRRDSRRVDRLRTRRRDVAGSSKVLYTVEGRNSSVAITQHGRRRH